MKTLFRTYRFALQPSKEEMVLLNRHFGCARWVYNYFLQERIELYRQHNVLNSYCAQAVALTRIKAKKETEWLKEVNSQSLQAALRNLDAAFKNFVQGKAKFPRFKSKKGRNSFTVPQHLSVKGDRLYLPKFKEGIKLKLHRKIEGLVKHCTISRMPTGKYFVSILCVVTYQPKKPTGKSCGIDLGIKDFAVTSDGVRFENHRYIIRNERALAIAQRHMAKKEKGSKNWDKQRLKVARLYEKVSNTRQDFLHKISTQIINAYDFIAVEDLNIKGMLSNRKLAKHISDVGWGVFVRLLEYKAECNEKRVLKIGRFFPSSRVCNECGWINKELKLKIRNWTCPNGHNLDRDLNAAKNILQEGLKLLSGGTLDYTHGDGSLELSGK